jgi:Dolichyl-phosphate-mannose-protein mannosyltransferase
MKLYDRKNKMEMKKTKQQKIFLVLIIAITSIAAFLRFYKLGSFSFSNDELSALNRIRYDSFSDLISEGVVLDYHPALVQVFLFYWTKIFGLSAFSIRLPFVLLGIASVPLAYLLGKKWFNEQTGLFLAASIAFFEFPLLYSHIARPYVVGLFGVLCLNLLWTKLLFEKKEKPAFRWKIVVALGFAYAFCMYNHYFSFLFVLIVGLSGLFFMRKQTWKEYLASAILAVLLFLPHLQITLTQMSYGGLENWLGAPTPEWIYLHFLYVFNDAFWLIIFTIVIVLISRIISEKAENKNIRFRILSLIYFTLPIIIGYFYSVKINPVLQHSILIFSMPFLFMFIFSFTRPAKKPLWNLLLLIVFSLAAIFSTVYQNQYFQKQHFGNFMEISTHLKNWAYEKESIAFLSNTNHPYYIDYYLAEDSTNIDFLQSRNDGTDEELLALTEILNTTDANSIAYASLKQTPAIVWGMIYSRFPVVEEYYEYDGSYVVLFSKVGTSDDAIEPLHLPYTMDFVKESKNYSYNTNSVDSLDGELVYRIDSNVEWGPGFRLESKDFYNEDNNYVEASVYTEVKGDPTGILLVISLDSIDGGNIVWQAADFKYFLQENKRGKVVFNLPFKTIEHTSESILSVYIWNKAKREVILYGFEMYFKSARLCNNAEYYLNNKY